MKRNAFTMIELVFVIVILGILAAVAIPKLSATRDDANIAVLAQGIMGGATEIAQYAVANEGIVSDLTVMSNQYQSLVGSGDAQNDAANSKITVKVGEITNCITVQVVTDGGADTLMITKGASTGDIKCDGLQRLIGEKDYPMLLRGIHVVN